MTNIPSQSIVCVSCRKTPEEKVQIFQEITSEAPSSKDEQLGEKTMNSSESPISDGTL